MTLDVPFRRWASIKVNHDYINVKACSGFRATIADTDQKNDYLILETSDYELGHHIREALNLSRFVHPIEQKELSMYLKNPDRYKEWLEFTMKKFGYKTKGQMFKPMFSCYATLQDHYITLQPNHQCNLEAWDSTGITDEDYVVVQETCTDQELGAAARLALSRCTSRWE